MPLRFSTIPLQVLLTLGIAIVAPGCADSDPTVPATSETVVIEDVSSTSDVKQRLELIAQYGEAGSALDGLEEAIQSGELESAKKDKLLADLKKLRSASKPEDIKSIANGMIAEL